MADKLASIDAEAMTSVTGGMDFWGGYSRGFSGGRKPWFGAEAKKGYYLGYEIRMRSQAAPGEAYPSCL